MFRARYSLALDETREKLMCSSTTLPSKNSHESRCDRSTGTDDGALGLR
jgi:hypothetical protein